jgi:tRNA A22 N-methylase
MKVTQLKKLLKEEIAAVKLEIITESVNNIYTDIKVKHKLKESIVADMLTLLLGPKLKAQADAVKNSPTYQELLKQIDINTKSMVRLTAKLKNTVDDYNTNLKSMQKVGLKVKAGNTPAQMQAAYDKWKKEQHAEFWKKHPAMANNPEWQKMLNY